MAHPDLEELMNSSLDLAKSLLDKYGEFYPFGMSKSKDGGGNINSGWNGDDRPKSQDVIEILVKNYQNEALAGKITSACICSDVKIHNKDFGDSDAISCELECINGESVMVYLPYKKTETSYTYDNLIAREKDLRFFTKK